MNNLEKNESQKLDDMQSCSNSGITKFVILEGKYDLIEMSNEPKEECFERIISLEFKTAD